MDMVAYPLPANDRVRGKTEFSFHIAVFPFDNRSIPGRPAQWAAGDAFSVTRHRDHAQTAGNSAIGICLAHFISQEVSSGNSNPRLTYIFNPLGCSAAQ